MTVGHCPGKIILAGEHAILAGCPALVIATTPWVQCSVRENRSGDIRMSLPGREEVQSDRNAVANRVKALHERHRSGLSPDSPEDVLLAALYQSAPEWSGEITFNTALPIGSGMGASAAFILSLMKALRPNTSSKDVYADALEIEHLQHGTSSGIDVWTCLHGGVWWITPQDRQRISLSYRPDFKLYHTGTPASSTGECVKQVQHQFPANHAVWKEFSRVIQETRSALETQETERWSVAIRENHCLLCQIGVVPETVQDDISQIEACGGSAKVCGAGSVTGHEAGVVLVRDADADTIPEHWSDIAAGICTIGAST